MNPRHVRQQLLPASECDPKFGQYLGRISCPGLKTIALVEIVAPLLLEAGRLATGSSEAFLLAVLWRVGAVSAIGLLTLAIAWSSWCKRHARVVAAFSAWMASAMFAWSGIHGPGDGPGTEDYILAGITLIVLAAVATVPLLPWHTFVLGLAV